MSLTAPFVADVVPVVFGNVIQTQTPAQVIALFPSTSKTPTANFSSSFNGHTLSFAKNATFVTTPALLVALTSQNAPIV